MYDIVRSYVMAYQALYRKYRPRLFSQVMGQEHITKTLKNQVASRHVAHAYLFCGSRGTGKTSTAKILAKAINCLSPENGEPCGTCRCCEHIAEEDVVDIIEIDAASNNGVDDMRMLLEKARFTPLHLPAKVYIIDEVHMLTTSAFNALLKTLEEPPAHVVFILATTEPQKLPATIISRCQRFDFRRLSIDTIIKNLHQVLEQAGAHIDPDGLQIIARAADGGMRDALSLADQCLAFCGTQVSTRDVQDVLGCMEEDFLFDAADALIRSNSKRALQLLDGIIDSGRDLGVFVQDLSQHMRALLVTKACGSCQDILDCTKETMLRYEQQAALCSEERLLRALNGLIRAQNEMKWLRQPRILVESILVRICRPEDESDLSALMDRIARLEARPAAPVAVSPVYAAAPSEEPDDLPPIDEPPEEMPPWDEPVPVPKAPSKSAAVPAAPAAPPQETAAPAADGGADAKSLLDTLLKTLQTRNISLYILAKNASGASLDGDQLTINFPSSQTAAVNALNTPRNFAMLRDALQQVKQGLRPHVQFEAAKAAPDPALAQLFGNKLVIEE